MIKEVRWRIFRIFRLSILQPRNQLTTTFCGSSHHHFSSVFSPIFYFRDTIYKQYYVRMVTIASYLPTYVKGIHHCFLLDTNCALPQIRIWYLENCFRMKKIPQNFYLQKTTRFFSCDDTYFRRNSFETKVMCLSLIHVTLGTFCSI